MGELRANEDRAKYAIVLIWVVLGMEAIALWSNYLQFNLLQKVASGVQISVAEATLNDTRVQLIAILGLVVYIISIVTFIQWFRRAYFNLHTQVNNLTYKEGWAAGSWFVPILCLFRPYQIMVELYERTSQLLTSNGIKAVRSLETQFLGLWWGLWILNGLLGNYTLRTSIRNETVDDFLKGTFMEMIGNVLTIVLAIITVKVIKDYSRNESLLVEIPKQAPADSAEIGIIQE